MTAFLRNLRRDELCLWLKVFSYQRHQLLRIDCDRCHHLLLQCCYPMTIVSQSKCQLNYLQHLLVINKLWTRATIKEFSHSLGNSEVKESVVAASSFNISSSRTGKVVIDVTSKWVGFKLSLNATLLSCKKSENFRYFMITDNK